MLFIALIFVTGLALVSIGGVKKNSTPEDVKQSINDEELITIILPTIDPEI